MTPVPPGPPGSSEPVGPADPTHPADPARAPDPVDPAAPPLAPGFHVMLKPRGPVCNLACRHCYYLSKKRLYPGSAFRMSEALLEDFTRQYLAAQRVPEVYFGWQGGEPTLMGLSFFRKAVAFQHKYQRPGTRVVNTFQTNGTLLNDAWARFFKKHGFLVGISIDGPPRLHDVYRRTKAGGKSSRKVLKGLRYLQKHEVEYNVLACVQASNMAHPLDVYRYLRDDLEVPFVQFIPIVERVNDTGFQEGTRVTKRSVPPAAYGRFLAAVFDEWVQHDVGQVFIQHFDVALAAWMGYPAPLCTFATTCGRALALEHNGDLYACDHFVEPRHRLGNVQETPLVELVNAPNQQDFGRSKFTALPPYCLECPVLFACHGGCLKNRFTTTPAGNPGLNYLCPSYKHFFTHVGPYMEYMVHLLRQRRPAAEIMDHLDEIPARGRENI